MTTWGKGLAAVAVTVGAVAVVGCGDDDDRAVGAAQAAATAARPAAVVRDAPEPRAAKVLQSVRVAPEPFSAAAAGRMLWVAGRSGVQRVDTATGRVHEVRGVPGKADAVITLDDGRVAIPSVAPAVLTLLDGTTGRVLRRLRGEPRACGAPAVLDGSLWWTTDRKANTVTRFDDRTGAIEARIEGVGSVGAGPCDLIAAEGRVWAGNEDRTLTAIDPATNRVVKTVETGPWPSFMVASGRDVWAANVLGRSMQRIDVRSGRVAMSWEGMGGGTMALHDDVLLATAQQDVTAQESPLPLLWVVDRTTGEVRSLLRVGPRMPRPVADGEKAPGPMRGVAVVGDDVWVVNGASNRAYRIAVS